MRLVTVEWVDSMSGNSWVQHKEVTGEPLPIIHSVGWAIERRKDSITIVSSFCTGNNMAGQTMQIPMGCIKRITLMSGRNSRLADAT